MLERLPPLLRKHWGFDTLRPLQDEAIRAILERRDSVVVLPTGGGKSLCYQAPALLLDGVVAVISPLISLMRDQVDSLRACGVPAVQFHSGISPEELRESEQMLRDSSAKLIFTSPERLLSGGFYRQLQRAGVRTFAIDEAHCISHWGHDFRPEYRQLRQLRELFPQASLHAFTATATPQVRDDIAAELELRDPAVLVGNFDRPNLTYRVVRRSDALGQVQQVLERHAGEAGIIYCISRREVDQLAADLKSQGLNARAYHAGMSPQERHKAQDAFRTEKCDLVVATVAFGMGINRTNVRFVLHVGMPKSIEHFQQETGRAGRDGLEAECVLLYSPGDPIKWKRLAEKSVENSEAEVPPEFIASQHRHIDEMAGFCRPGRCRHRALVEHFGQEHTTENCGACDNCLDEFPPVPEGQTIAKKILSCVYRVQERFGQRHVVQVLRGANRDAVRKNGHDKLTTFGLLREHSDQEVGDWIQQLVTLQVLQIAEGEYPTLHLNPASWDVMHDRRTVTLWQTLPVEEETDETETAGTSTRKPRREKRSRTETVSWEGVDTGLFDALRELRKNLAAEKGLPPYLIFHDGTLRELARVRPGALSGMRLVSGIGDKKLEDFGEPFLDAINDYCGEKGISRDNTIRNIQYAAPPPAVPVRPADFDAAKRADGRINPTLQQALELFRRGTSVEETARQTGRAPSTVMQYLAEYIAQERPASIAAWVEPAVYKRVAAAARQFEFPRLKVLFESLEGKITYDQLRLVVTHVQATDPAPR
jgi:ATP-dependent DNA helicase RecQ